MSGKEYEAAIDQWHQKRIQSLKKEDSWLSLAGLYRIEEGAQSMGADSSHEVVFPPKAPATVGTITKKGSSFVFKTNPDTRITHDGEPVSRLTLRTDAGGDPTILRQGTLLWYVIERRDNHYLRLKDSGHPNFATFDGIERFPVTKKWRVRAEFHRFEEPRIVSIPDILGDVYQDSVYGRLTFKVDERTYTLSPLGHPDKDEDFFIIFGDRTNGQSTYHGGRYIYVKTPAGDGTTFIDFNKAYNPPCVFTEFATCPLPPKQNRLPLRVTAGEKMYPQAKKTGA